MKKLNLLIISSILMIVTSCAFEIKKDTETELVKFEKTELSGYWIQTSKIEDAEKSKEGIIWKINLKKDMTAEVEILDAHGHKTITGNWDISHHQKLLMSVEQPNQKIILTSHKLKFDKI